MYGLSDDVDLSAFVGRELIQICIGQSDVQLHFQDEADQPFVQISWQGSFSFKGERYEDARSSGVLTALMGRVIDSAGRVGTGDLRLDFDAEAGELVVHDDDMPYESYHFYIGADLYVV